MKKANLAGAVWLRPAGIFGEFDVKFTPNFRSVNLTNSWAKFDEKIKMFFTRVVKFARLNLTNDFVKFDVSKRGDICAQACVFVKFGSNLVKSLGGLIKKEA